MKRNWSVINLLGDELWKRLAFELDPKNLAELQRQYPMFFMEGADDGPRRFPLSQLRALARTDPKMPSNCSILVREKKTAKYPKRVTEYPHVSYRGDIEGMRPPYDLVDAMRGKRLKHPMIIEYKGQRLLFVCLGWSYSTKDDHPKYGNLLKIPRWRVMREVHLIDMRYINETA